MNSIGSMRIGDGLATLWRRLTGGRGLSRGATWGLMIVGALVAFEIFNFSTTEFALHDVLGDLTFAGLPWATVLAVAFCGIDFAGIARLFTPQQGRDEPAEVWYLFSAWLLAAGFNATLTWWGVSVAIANHPSVSGAILGGETLTKVVPVFVAVMVWLIRVLIIGSFSAGGNQLFSTASVRSQSPRMSQSPALRAPLGQSGSLRSAAPMARPVSTSSFRPAPKAVPQSSLDVPEPIYQSLSLEAAGHAASRDHKLQ